MLTALDATLARLQVPTLATAVLVQVRQDAGQVETGSCTVRWSNAGLVERRGEDLDAGTERLRRTAAALAHLPVDELCDALLKRLASDLGDDVALLAMRARRCPPPS